jgi:hypothetical protein
MKFILTIDTEGDNQWDHGRGLSVENIRFVPRFQDLCEKHSIKPTYLVTSEICDDAFAREIFTGYSSAGTAEVGAHLHSWTTPPFLDKDGLRFNDVSHAFATELPEDLLSQKVKNLTDQIEASFGKRPSSFRSGRFGFNEKLAGILADNYYLVDSSITPFSSWSVNKGMPDGKGGPDFINADPFPHRYNFGNRSLIEIPVTILPTRFPLNTNHSLARYYLSNVDKSIVLRFIRRLLYRNQPLWLRPLIWMNSKLFSELINEAQRINLPNMVMMFHSSELMPGCSIYRKDKGEIDKLYDTLDQFFVLLSERKIISFTLTEAARTLSL